MVGYHVRMLDEAKPHLRITPTMRRQMRGNEAQILAWIRPEDFLYITTDSDASMQQIKDQALSLDAYNKFSAEGSTIIPPYLRITIYSATEATVDTHEGRHRAAALIAAGAKRMAVHLRVRLARGYQPKYNLPDNGNRYVKDIWRVGFTDLPERINCETRNEKFPRSVFKVIRDRMMLDEKFHSHFVNFRRGERSTVEMYKNPTTRELAEVSEVNDAYGGEVRAFAHGNDLYVWPIAVLHHEANQHLKLKDPISLAMYVMGGKVQGVTVTDYSRNTKWDHSPKVAAAIRKCRALKAVADPDMEITYWDEAIGGPWDDTVSKIDALLRDAATIPDEDL